MTWFKKSVNGLWCASHVRTEDFMSSIWLLMRLKPSDFYPSTLRTPRWKLTLTLLTQTLLTLLTLILSLTLARDSPSFFHVLLGCTTTVAPQSVFRLNQWIGSCKCYGNVAHLQTIRALLCDLEPPSVDYLGSFLERDWYDSYLATVGFVLSLVSKDRSCVNESFTTEKLIDFVFQVFIFLCVFWLCYETDITNKWFGTLTFDAFSNWNCFKLNDSCKRNVCCSFIFCYWDQMSDQSWNIHYCIL